MTISANVVTSGARSWARWLAATDLTTAPVCDLRNAYSALRDAGLLVGSVAAALRLRAKRAGNRPERPAARGRVAKLAAANLSRRSVPRLVILGTQQQAHWLGRARGANPGLREWSHGASAMTWASIGRDFGHPGWTVYTTGSNSNWSQRSTFRRGIRVESSATCVDPQVLVYRVAGDEHRIPAPRGHRWDVDSEGVYLRRQGRPDDPRAYHPNGDELLLLFTDHRTGWRNLKGAIAERDRRRREAAQRARAERRATAAEDAERRRAIRSGELMISVTDSRRAGNCAAGTVAWAEAHGVDHRAHIPARVLARHESDPRVAAVLRVAWRRHREEMARGYSLLAEHGLTPRARAERRAAVAGFLASRGWPTTQA